MHLYELDFTIPIHNAGDQGYYTVPHDNITGQLVSATLQSSQVGKLSGIILVPIYLDANNIYFSYYYAKANTTEFLAHLRIITYTL